MIRLVSKRAVTGSALATRRCCSVESKSNAMGKPKTPEEIEKELEEKERRLDAEADKDFELTKRRNQFAFERFFRNDQAMHDALGVGFAADKTEIGRAYAAISHQNHPEKNPNDEGALDRFTCASRAFQIMMNPALRKLFQTSTLEEVENHLVEPLVLYNMIFSVGDLQRQQYLHADAKGTLYEPLGVTSTAYVGSICEAYCKEATRFHPRIGKEPSMARFEEVSYAYQVLSNRVDRAKYDMDRSFRIAPALVDDAETLYSLVLGDSRTERFSGRLFDVSIHDRFIPRKAAQQMLDTSPSLASALSTAELESFQSSLASMLDRMQHAASEIDNEVDSAITAFLPHSYRLMRAVADEYTAVGTLFRGIVSSSLKRALFFNARHTLYREAACSRAMIQLETRFNETIDRRYHKSVADDMTDATIAVARLNLYTAAHGLCYKSNDSYETRLARSQAMIDLGARMQERLAQTQ